MTTNEILYFSKMGEFKKLTAKSTMRDDENILAENGAFIFDGCLQRANKQEIFKSWSLVDPSPILLFPLAYTKVILFKTQKVKNADKMQQSRRRSNSVSPSPLIFLVHPSPDEVPSRKRSRNDEVEVGWY